MAQRVGVDTSSLRGMNKGLRVVARPVDTYSSVGNQVDRNSKGLQVANALASFEPKLSEFFDGQIQKRNKTDLAEGMRQYLDADPDARENFRKAIKSGEIDLVQSPFFIKGLTSGILKEKSREFGSKMVEEWSQRKDNAGFDVSDFIAQSQDLFITENGLADYDPELFAAEFAPRAENYANIVGQRHYEHKIKRAKQARLDLIPSDMIAAYESNLSEQGELQPKGYIKSVNKVIEGVIKDGLNPAAAIAGAVDHLTALAMSDETIADTKLYQDALRDLKVKGGTYGQTGKGSLYLQQLDDKVDTKIERLEREKDTEVEDEQRNQAKTFYQDFVKMHNSYNGKDFFNDAAVSAELENAHQNPYFAQYYNQLKIIDQDRRLVTTDTDTFNKLSQKAEKGTLTSQDVLNSSHLLSSQHFNALNAATDTVSRAGSLASVLGADFVAQFVSDVTRVEEATDIQKLMMTATGRGVYDQLAADAQFSANSVLMELLGDKTYSDGLGSREGNLAFKNELEKRLEAEQTKKGGFNDRRDAISKKASEAQDIADQIEIEVERTTQLTDQGMSDVQIQDTSHIPVLPPDQAALEVSRPPNKLSYDVTWKEGDITPFSDMSIEEIHKIMNEYTSVKTGEGGTLQSWETSKAWVMMQEMGLNETELAALFSEHIRVQGPIEEAERIEKLEAERKRQQAELSGPALSDQDQDVVDENELDAIEMHGPEKVAQYKLDYPDTYLAKLMLETEQPDFVAFEAEPFEPAETDTRQESGAEVPPSILMRMVSQEQYDAMSVDAQQKADQQAIEDQEAETAAEAEAVANVASELIYDASDEQIELISGVLSGYDLSDTNAIAAQVQKVFPDINEQQLRDIIQRVGPNTAPEGVDMASPSMVSPTSSMQSPSMGSSSPDGTVNTGVSPKSATSMMPASSKAQLPKAGKQDEAVAPVSRQDERQMRKVLRDLRMAEAQQLSKLEADADKAAAAADLKRLDAKKQKELKAEIARRREQDKQEFLKRQSLMQSKGIAKFIAERAEKFPEKFGVTMSDDLDSYLAKTKPLWFALWDGLLPDGQEIPAVFYEVLKENMRKRIPN